MRISDMSFQISLLLICLHGSHIFASPHGDHHGHGHDNHDHGHVENNTSNEHAHMDQGKQQNYVKFDNQTTPLPVVKKRMKVCMCHKSKMDSTFSNIADSFLEKIQQKSFPNGKKKLFLDNILKIMQNYYKNCKKVDFMDIFVWLK